MAGKCGELTLRDVVQEQDDVRKRAQQTTRCTSSVTFSRGKLLVEVLNLLGGEAKGAREHRVRDASQCQKSRHRPDGMHLQILF